MRPLVAATLLDADTTSARRILAIVGLLLPYSPSVGSKSGARQGCPSERGGPSRLYNGRNVGSHVGFANAGR
jgi:hypothetical protein